MRPDLEAINAALRLGDWRVPPLGTAIQVWGHYSEIDELYHVIGYLKQPYDSPNLNPNFRVSGCNEIGRITRYVYRSELYQVLEVPKDSPPFDEWERPRHD